MNLEDALQAKIVVWYKNNYQMHGKGLIHSTPNGGFRNVAEAKKMKATGTTAGIADLTIKLPNSIFIDIELKAPKGVQSEVQKKIQSKLEAMNCNYIIVRSLDEFIEKVIPLVDKYLSNEA